MPKTSKKAVALVAVVLATVFAAPLAAYSAPYTMGAQFFADDYTATPNQTVRVTADPGYFVAGERVSVDFDGDSGRVSSTSIEKTADADGGLAVALVVPAASTGEYTVTAVSESASGALTLSVVSADTPVTDGVGVTGSELPLVLIWLLGGLGVLGIAYFAVRATTRRAARDL